MNKEILTILKDNETCDIDKIFIDSIKKSENKSLRIITKNQFIISVDNEFYHCFITSNNLDDAFKLKNKSSVIMSYFLNDIKKLTIYINLQELFKLFDEIEYVKTEELSIIFNKIKT